MVNIQHAFNINGVLQLCLNPDGGEPLDKMAFFLINTPNHNICISYVNG